MREKTPKVVVTFSATADAMAMKDAATRFGIPGRIIPVPSAISAGCGYAWCAPASEREAVETALAHHALAFDALHETLLY